MSASTEFVSFGGLGVRFLVDGSQTGGRFALVEHPIAPRALAAPTHTHEREDEYSYVVSGRLGVRIGDDEREAGPGELVEKPRGIPHAFWNASDEQTVLVELISPAGFEDYFREIAGLLPPATDQPQMERLGEIRERYGLSMDFSNMDDLIERHGLDRKALL